LIIAFIGGIGSGKTISIVREIIKSENYPVTNFNLKNIKHHRLKYSDIIREIEKVGLDKKKRKIKQVNWNFWSRLLNKHKNFSIYLDEAHNIINSRSSMSKDNILLGKWVSQIRKVLADNEQNHLYIITQQLRKIDVNFRDLTQIVVSCQQITYKNNIYILHKFYDGFDKYNINKVSAKGYFHANPYFKYYDTKEMVTFDDVDIYV